MTVKEFKGQLLLLLLPEPLWFMLLWHSKAGQVSLWLIASSVWLKALRKGPPGSLSLWQHQAGPPCQPELCLPDPRPRQRAQAFPSWQVLLVDVRCHGESSSVSLGQQPHSIASAAADIMALLSRLRLFPQARLGLVLSYKQRSPQVAVRQGISGMAGE